MTEDNILQPESHPEVPPKAEKKGELADWTKSYVPVISLIFVIAAFILGIYNTNRSIKFGENMVRQVERIDSVFSRIEGRIEALPKSVLKFDSTIQGMNAVVQEQQRELASSIGGLRQDVDLFSKSLMSYDSTLKAIAEASDKNLKLLQKSNARWEEEISKKPELWLSADKVVRIREDTLHVFLRIINEGNQIAENCRIVLEVPVNFQLIATGWKGVDVPERGVVSWSYPTEPIDIIYYQSKPGMAYTMSRIYMNFKLRIPPKTTFPQKFYYTLYHKRGDPKEDSLVIQP